MAINTSQDNKTQNNETLLVKLLDYQSTALVLIDDQLVIHYLNPSAESLFANSKTHLLGMGLESIFKKDIQSLNDFQNAIKNTRSFTQRAHQVQAGSDNPITVDYTASPLTWQGKPGYLLIELVQIDRINRINKEESISHTHQSTQLLLQGVAHEVKNPLGGIRGAAQLLEKELTDTSLKDYTQIIIEEVDRLQNLVNRMLGPRKLPQYSNCNIHEILERVFHLVDTESLGTIKIRRDYDISLPTLEGDKDQLIQMFFNIVRNAVQALHENKIQKKPEITAVTRIVRQCTLLGKQHKLAICIKIIDNGPGVPEYLLPSIFFPMVSGRAEGTGLGLPLAQNIINQHKGIVECDSHEGKTEFTIIIPVKNL